MFLESQNKVTKFPNYLTLLLTLLLKLILNLVIYFIGSWAGSITNPIASLGMPLVATLGVDP
jgi:hypothetical protein